MTAPDDGSYSGQFGGAGQGFDPAATACRLIRLRRDGLPPLRFSGRIIGRHDGSVRRATVWHDVALYRTAAAAFAVEIVAQLLTDVPVEAFGLQVRPVRCHAALFETLADALTALENHDASQDVCPGISGPSLSLNDASVPTAMLMTQAAVLQGLCRDVVRRYRIGVGVLLANIGLRDLK